MLDFAGNKTISIPGAVKNEVERKLAKRRFACGKGHWDWFLGQPNVEVLDDDYKKLYPYVRLYSGPGFTFQEGKAKHLGEYIAIAHCLYVKDQDNGVATALIMDDGDACELARKQKAGYVFNTEHVLLQCVKLGSIGSRGQAKNIWKNLQKFDVLVNFEHTKLNGKSLYKRTPKKDES
ncbi:hypothetical protein [Corynebacterium amycolatum]|uniref:hypothetical protein n=1 Tax=Corynebacterium amycolatum TaxID=43765 RepID=UPI0011787704|nr:hypothetical protein [Corynebacterium amycolatum]